MSRKLTTEEIVNKFKNIHGNKYDYSEFEYIDCKTKGIIKCHKHGKFLQRVNSHLQGKGCPKCCHTYSNKCNKWLNTFNNTNIIRNYRTTINGRKFEFDGFDPITNTIYEFYGGFWHGDLRIFGYDIINKVRKRTFGQLYKSTMEREILIKLLGCNLITIWESDWDEIEKQNKQVMLEPSSQQLANGEAF